jgi:hypothetical protein
MAGAAPPGRGGSLLRLLAATSVLLLGVVLVLAALLIRPATTSTASAPAAPPAPGPSGAPSTSAGQARAHQQYRAYISTVIQGGTAVVAGLAGLEDCRTGRQACANRLGEASAQVAGLQRDLTTNPAPPCLAAADERLQDSLSFERKGLDSAREGVRTEDRLRLVQGLLLAAAGFWRAGQAMVEGRQSNC